jgi:hypothetical protein
MIILDLQHIESATETRVQGGRGGGCKPPGGGWRKYCNTARAEAGSEAFGSNTETSTTTDTLVVQEQFSGSISSSIAEAS